MLSQCMTPFTPTVVFPRLPWIIHLSDCFWRNHKHQELIFSFLLAASSDVSAGYHPAPLHSSLEPQQLCLATMFCRVQAVDCDWFFSHCTITLHHWVSTNYFFKQFSVGITLEEEKRVILFKNAANHPWRENSPMHMELRVNLRLCELTPASFQCMGGQQLR